MFTAGVIDAGSKFLPQVSLKPSATSFRRLTSGKFASGVNNNDGKFSNRADSTTPSGLPPCHQSWRSSMTAMLVDCLRQGMSHEIDFKNVVENGQILALIRPAAGF